MTELDTSFSSLFGRVYDSGEDLGYQERKVSNLVEGKQNIGFVLRTAAKSGVDPVPLRVFEGVKSGFPVFRDRAFVIHGVEEFNGANVYSVSSEENQDPSLVEFVVTEGEFRGDYLSGEPKEVTHISFCTNVIPVDERS